MIKNNQDKNEDNNNNRHNDNEDNHNVIAVTMMKRCEF